MMRRVDLLPERYALRRRERRNITLILVAGFLVLLLLIGYWFLLRARIGDANDALDDARRQNDTLNRQIAELRIFAELEAEVQAKESALATVMAGDLAWPAILTEVAMVVPGEVWLTSFTASAGTTEGAAPVGTETAAVRLSPETPTGRIQFNGSSLSMPGVAKWLIRLGLADKIDVNAVYLNSAQSTQEGGEAAGPEIFTFDSTVELGQKALSGRFSRGLP